MKIKSMKIQLRDMHFYAYHGVLSQERHVGNHFVLQLTTWVQVAQSLHSDSLGDTVNYAEIYDVVAQEMTIPSQLLEHVVGRIAERLFSSFPQIDRLSLTLSKAKPPFSGEVSETSFTLEASRE